MDIRMAADELQESEGKSCPTRYLRFEGFYLDLQRQVLSKNDVRVHIAGKMFEVLRALLENPGQVVSREELRARLWPEKTLNYEANINTTVNKLRQALGRLGDAPTLIETVPGMGYMLDADVERLDQKIAIPSWLSKEQRTAQDPVRASMPWSVIWSSRGGVWFAAGVIALVVAAMLLGAAITLYLHRTS